MENQDLMTINEASEFLKIHIDTLRRKTSRNHIPFAKMPHSNRIYFSKKQLSEWLFPNTHPQPALK